MPSPRKNPHRKQVYSLYEVAEMFGLKTGVIDRMVRDNDFRNIPFGIISMNGRYYCPKVQVDNFVKEGKRPNFDKAHLRRNGTMLWNPGEYINWNFRIPIHLADKFKRVCDRMNEELPVKVPIQHYRLIAFQEFIDRRPEYCDDGDDDNGRDKE